MSIFSTGVLRTNSQEISTLLGFTIMQSSFPLTLLSLSLSLSHEYLVCCHQQFLFQNNNTLNTLLSRIFCNFAVYVLFNCFKFLLWNFPLVNNFLSSTSIRTYLSLARSYTRLWVYPVSTSNKPGFANLLS